MLSGSIFHIIDTATEKARVPVFVLILGTAGKFELDNRSCLQCLAGMSVEKKYECCLDERTWQMFAHILNMMQNRTGNGNTLAVKYALCSNIMRGLVILRL